ncbi:MAG: hypothetical protein ACREO8_06235 [Luteimonas sp.]
MSAARAWQRAVSVGALVFASLASAAMPAQDTGAVRSAATATPTTPAAQTAAPEAAAEVWSPLTGDAWIDRQLADINVYGNRYRSAFVDEVVRYHAAPRALVAELLASRGWLPGDAYYACALAQIIGRPCRAVAALRERASADGWEAIIAAAGVTDHNDVDTRMKQAIATSYRHWARPLAKPGTTSPARNKHRALP